ncbi:hypothetical protein BO71DRAFT_488349 [Aspergillus ellipticus CBS 707.79]|uniref:Uncharacterized protein n=1 Tax=Aspergillus ellipticus CBS 707.79 TaxID=1448320 RepID=A0A319D392_9EURO|nr:hypothetical protein BO71DRAFT_488349 [Aspergillus ellipticus CBS 707.79]
MAATPPQSHLPGAQITEPPAVTSRTAKRPHVVHELIARLDRYCLIRVNGTPASGKTTVMNLLANELLLRYPETPKKWGLELLRSGDRIKQHMQRFKKKGQYFGLIENGSMEHFVVLDFTQAPQKKPHPEYRNNLYHIMFSEEFRRVHVIDASDLSEVDSFVLTENVCVFR